MISRRAKQSDNINNDDEELKLPLARTDSNGNTTTMEGSKSTASSKKSIGEGLEHESCTFATTLLITSLIIHKIIICCLDETTGVLKLRSVMTYLWLPSVFTFDLVYAILVISLFRVVSSCMQSRDHGNFSMSCLSPPSFLRMIRPNRWYFARKIVIFFYQINIVITVIITSLEIKSLIVLRQNIIWTKTYSMLRQWDEFRVLIQEKADNGVSVQTIFFRQIIFALIIMVLVKFTRFDICQRVEFRQKRSKVQVILTILYLFIAIIMRPSHPYKLYSRTPMINVPFDIIMGAISDMKSEEEIYDFVEYQERKNDLLRNALDASHGDVDHPERKNDLLKNALNPSHDNEDHSERKNDFLRNTLNPSRDNKIRKVNVVLIMLETMRADMFPFDPTTDWAKEKIPETEILVNSTNNIVTPFYAELVKKPNTLYIPHIRGASSFTHKALWSIHCSAYGRPRAGTHEHNAKYFHDCLPHILEKSGVGYTNHQFFKSITSTFDHQSSLAANIGFEHMYGEKEFNDEYDPTDKWIDTHRANYFGYEDDIMIDTIMKWVDKQAANKEPFFFSYLTGATHDPYEMPPQVSWKPQKFADDKKINSFLNEVAYTDRFISKIIGGFKERNLLNETLFVIMGDHGVNIKNRKNQFTTYFQNGEETLDIGVSFYSENEEISNVLGNIRKNNEEAQHNNTYSSIDIAPTILDLLNIFGENSTTVLNGKYKDSIVDGRSMLIPSGKRLQFSLANPGDGMILKDGPYVLLLPNKKREYFKYKQLWNLDTDPKQEHPIGMGNDVLDDERTQKVIHWGKQAERFLRELEASLYSVIVQGNQCNTEQCPIRLLSSLESLDQWAEWERYKNQ